MASSLAAISGVSSHELIVEMRADRGKKIYVHFSDREERRAFTGPCIIKQLRKLIRASGDGGEGVEISHLIIAIATASLTCEVCKRMPVYTGAAQLPQSVREPPSAKR